MSMRERERERKREMKCRRRTLERPSMKKK